MRAISSRARGILLAAAAIVLLLGWVTWKPSPSAPAPATANPSATAAAPASSSSSGERIRTAAAAPDVRIARETRTGTNAADLYKNAIALSKTLTLDELKMLASPREPVDAAAAEALYRKSQPIMDLLRRAQAEGAYCDWGFGPPGIDTLMPQLSPVRDLARLAAWEIGYRFPSDPEGAIGDLSAQSYLADSVKDQALIGFLVGSWINNIGADVLRDNLGALNPAALTQATEFLQTLSPSADLARAMETEEQFSLSLIDTLADPKTRDQTWQLLMASATPDQRLAAPPDPAALTAQANWLAATEREFASRAFAPDAEFAPWSSQVKSQPGAQGPLAAETLPALERVRVNTQYMEVRRAMLLSALAAVQGGPAGASAIADPVTKQPFAYVPTDTGFELRSTFLYKGQPLSMTFNRPAP